MINIVALSLLVSSLAAGGILSPPPDPNPNPVLREGHRLIVVEYEREAPPASSPSLPPSPSHAELAEDDNEKLPDGGASVISHPSKDKISSLITKTKHKVAQLEESGADAVASVTGKVKDAAEDVAANISAATKKAVDRAEVTAEELRGNLTDILRRARDLWRDAAVHVGVGAARAARSALAVSHLLGFGIAFGTCVWVTFLSSHVLASSLARQQFAVVQSRIYPVYFRAVGLGVGAAVAAVFLGSAGRGAAERTQGYNLLAVLAMVLVNMLYLEPKATKAMFERMKLEKEEGRGMDILNAGTEPAPVRPPPAPIDSGRRTKKAAAEQDAAKIHMSQAGSRLRRLNSYSSFLNVLCLMALGWHLVHIARRLESSC